MREEGKEEEENGITGEKAAEGDGRRREDRGSAGGSARPWLRLTLPTPPRGPPRGRDPAAGWPLRPARPLAAAIELRVEAVDQLLAATMRPACRLSVRSVTAHGPYCASYCSTAEHSSFVAN